MTTGKQRQRKRVVKRFRGPQEPPPTLYFLSGSQEELVRLTVCACHVHAQVFETKQFLEVTYLPIDSPYLLTALATEPEREEEDLLLLEPLEKILAVLYAYNAFQVVGKSRNALDNLKEVRLEVYLPSAHERAEALLALSEWLEGKVSEQKKRELLQLPEDVEV